MSTKHHSGSITDNINDADLCNQQQEMCYENFKQKFREIE